MNRKGDITLKNALSFIVAIILLALLIFLGVKVYDTFLSQDNRNAQNFINSLTAKVEALEDGQSNSFLLPGVEDWYILGYDLQDSDGPEKCFLQSCLCICPGVSPESCQERGVCNDIDSESVEISSMAVLDYSSTDTGFGGIGSSIPFTYDNREFSAECIKLTSTQLFEIRVDKIQNELSISYDYGFIDKSSEGDKFVPVLTSGCNGILG